MKTKIVYSCTSDSGDIYMEQTYFSVYSLKYHNPDAYSILVVDRQTEEALKGGQRWKILAFFNEKVVVDCPQGYNKMLRSRYVKTGIRQFVEGDYLYIDADTIITGPLSEIDNISGNICAVGDKHVLLKEHPKKDVIKRISEKVGWDFDEERYYFNSGVMFVRDNQQTRGFYQLWQQVWTENIKIGVHQDQPALAKADILAGNIINHLDDVWNCQITDNGLRYLEEAKVIHYFSSTINLEASQSQYLFLNKKLMMSIRPEYEISEELKDMILTPRRQFNRNLRLVPKAYTDLMDSPSFLYLYRMSNKSKRLFRIINRLLYLCDKFCS